MREPFGLLVAIVLAAACAPAPSAHAGQAGLRFVARSPDSQPTPINSASPISTQTGPAETMVAFAGLPAGLYPTHLHAVCSGKRAFHLTVLPSLRIGADGVGRIQVPTSYFGRGLCLIVYSSPALARVLTTRRI